MGNTRGTQGGAGALNTALSPNVTVRQRPREGHPCRHRGGGGGGKGPEAQGCLAASRHSEVRAAVLGP